MSAQPNSASDATGSSLAFEAARRWTRVPVDPVTLQVVGGAFRAIAKEMAQLLFRMAYSSIMRESEDIGAGIFDPDGREICESDSTPMHCGSLPAYIRGVNRRLAGTYQPGDVVVHNHPYYGASHSPDYGVIVPVFFGGQHIAFAACTGHMMDIGAAFPGFAVDVPDLYAEGNLLDALKIYDAGRRNDALWTHIMDNVRTPEANTGDLEAMISCCRLGERRFAQLLERYGRDVVMSAAEEWMDYAERMLRREIEKVPDGVYPAPDGWLEDDGKHWNIPLKIATTVEVRGSDITVDLTGSAPETTTGFNVPFEGSVLPTANFAIRTLFLDEALCEEYVPQNEGVFRPIRVIAPRGSIFNPRFPRGCEARFVEINRIPDQVLQAFARALPERVTAGNSANVSAVVCSGTLPGTEQFWMHMEINEGSYGGRCGKDGIDAIDALMANTRNNPIEEIEMRAPMRCERYELRDDPPAPGRWRGGLGAIRRWRFLADTLMSATGDHRTVDPPRGLFGGHDGQPGRLIKNPGTATEQELPSKPTDVRLARDDVLEVVLVSAAGYGDPFQRDSQAVLDDVLDALVSIEDAREHYGVVIDPAAMTVDVEATARLRARP